LWLFFSLFLVFLETLTNFKNPDKIRHASSVGTRSTYLAAHSGGYRSGPQNARMPGSVQQPAGKFNGTKLTFHWMK
jgi:hypothetical protein